MDFSMRPFFTHENEESYYLAVSAGLESKIAHDHKLKNLAPYSILYYEKNVGFFLDSIQVTYVDEINQETIADFVSKLMDKGNRAIVSRVSRDSGGAGNAEQNAQARRDLRYLAQH